MLYGIDPEFVPHYRLLTHPNYLFAQNLSCLRSHPPSQINKGPVAKQLKMGGWWRDRCGKGWKRGMEIKTILLFWWLQFEVQITPELAHFCKCHTSTGSGIESSIRGLHSDPWAPQGATLQGESPPWHWVGHHSGRNQLHGTIERKERRCDKGAQEVTPWGTFNLELVLFITSRE